MRDAEEPGARIPDGGVELCALPRTGKGGLHDVRSGLAIADDARGEVVQLLEVPLVQLRERVATALREAGDQTFVVCELQLACSGHDSLPPESFSDSRVGDAM